MCLTTSKPIATKINEDIRSYKLLIKRNGELISPFQCFKYELGKEYVSELDQYTTSVEYGFHTNKYFGMNPADIKTLKKYTFEENDELVIASCIIPKNSNVIFGDWKEFINEEQYTGFASDKLIIDKILKTL